MIKAALMATVWTFVVCMAVVIAAAMWPLSGIALMWAIFYLGAKHG